MRINNIILALAALLSFFVVVFAAKAMLVDSPRQAPEEMKSAPPFKEDLGRTAPLCDHCNVVIISSDSMRADHLGCYGYGRNTTPSIDSIAKEGILFENMFTPRGETYPSLTSMFTSLYPKSSGVRINNDMPKNGTLTMHLSLKGEGYVNSAFIPAFCENPYYGVDYRFCSAKDSVLTEKAIEWLGENRNNSFSLWIHYSNTHYPYSPAKEFDIFTDKHYGGAYNGSRDQVVDITLNKINLSERDLNHIISLYDGELLYADSEIRKVYDALDGLGLLNDTILVITADHGDDLYQHDYYFYHSCSIYDSTLHIPFIIRLPGGARGGTRIPDIVETIDIAPTILELVNVSIPYSFQGGSMLSLLDPGHADNRFSSALSELARGRILSIRTDEWRYIYNPYNRTATCLKTRAGVPVTTYNVDAEELYDKLRDPNETTNVIGDHPQVANSLREYLLSHYGRYKETKPERAGEETLEELRGLGYVV